MLLNYLFSLSNPYVTLKICAFQTKFCVSSFSIEVNDPIIKLKGNNIIQVTF